MLLKKFCEITSCNGIIDLYESRDNKWAFAFWVCVMLSMFGLSVYFTYNTILGYIRSPTVTNVATYAEPVIELPSALICYLGGVDVASMKKDGFNENFIKNFQAALKSRAFNENNSDTEFLNYLEYKKISVVEFVGKTGFNCPDFVASYLCGISWSIPCSKCHVLLNDYGKCYLFKNNCTQEWPGKTGGFSVQLKQPNNSFYEIYTKDAVRLGLIDGFYITLEKNFGYQGTDRNILIPMNTKVEVTLNTKLYVRQRNCDSSSHHFSSNSCFFQRYITGVEKKLGCVPIHYWDNSPDLNRSACNPFKWATTNTATVDLEQECQPKCDEWIFENTVSMVYVDRNLLDEPSSSVSIFYNTMQYTKIEEVEAFTMDMAVANVGGQSGLWLGVSLVTIIQAFYYCLLWIRDKCFPTKSTIKSIKR